MQYSAESFLQLHHVSEDEFMRELEYRRLVRERIDERRAAGREPGHGRHFFWSHD
ncbi:hypothetical protein [Subtercola sp. YIM 133946]|uniref:hypothetical protein n=1 Tax=Subtercola sp. YIM 133946 TaxID=3118909 RepID=UPI002F94D416